MSRLPNLPQLLPIWAGAISHRRETDGTRGRDRATVEQKEKDNIAFSTCCSFKWVLPASRARAIIQLPACTQAKPARLVHLHKCQPRRCTCKHTQLGPSAHRHNLCNTYLRHTHTHTTAELVVLRERLYKAWLSLV